MIIKLIVLWIALNVFCVLLFDRILRWDRRRFGGGENE